MIENFCCSVVLVVLMIFIRLQSQSHISLLGAGIGNFLIFYPAAFYFAALTGRDIIIADDSLVGEMCKVLYCGFPHFSNVASAFPSILNAEKLNRIRGAKAWDFHRHISGESVLDDSLIRADGYKYMSGWYVGYNHTNECIRFVNLL